CSSSWRSCSAFLRWNRERMRSGTVYSQRSSWRMSQPLEREHPRDRTRDPLPIRGFLVEAFLSEARQRVELCAPIVLAGAPLAPDPACLLEFVESRVERTVADLQDVVGYLRQALADRPPVERLDGENLED